MKQEFLPIYEKLGIRIANLRRARTLGQKEVAEKSGIETKTLSKIERAQVGMSLDTLFMLARTLSVSPSDLLNFEELDKTDKST